ncbi:hypothetical protein [Actinomadura chokoriensis]|uniref:hypothetical protein n=1 Tax=Actinomadura chokoriensis TaxID=454156 RepID=UPI0031FA465E
MIDERDIAAVAALLDDAHVGQAHEITGPRSFAPVQQPPSSAPASSPAPSTAHHAEQFR